MESPGPSHRLVRRGAGCLALLALELGWAGGASAESPVAAETTARLELVARPECAGRGELVARVGLRSPRIHFVERITDGPLLRVAVVSDRKGAAAAELTVIEAGGRPSTRRLVAATCDEAVDAVALMIAVMLDPTVAAAAAAPSSAPSSTSSPVSSAASSSSSPSASASAPAAGSEVGSTTHAAPPAPPAAAVPATVAAPAAPPPSPAAPRPAPLATETAAGAAPAAPPAPAVPRFGAGAQVEGISGPAPRIMLGVAVDAFWALDRPSIWSPALRLAASHSQLSGWVAAGGTADFALDALQLDLCPLGLRGTWFGWARLGLRGCATGVAGRLSASGSDTYAPQSHDRPFASLGGGAILSMALGDHVAVEGLAGAGVTLIRDAFEFSPEVFHRVSALTTTFGLGLSVQFP